jgi:hypothetical protein
MKGLIPAVFLERLQRDHVRDPQGHVEFFSADRTTNPGIYSPKVMQVRLDR